MLSIIKGNGVDNKHLYLKVQDGTYNGQLKKVLVHPSWVGDTNDKQINILIENSVIQMVRDMKAIIMRLKLF